jgi:hypothetical protein
MSTEQKKSLFQRWRHDEERTSELIQEMEDSDELWVHAELASYYHNIQQYKFAACHYAIASKVNTDIYAFLMSEIPNYSDYLHDIMTEDEFQAVIDVIENMLRKDAS